MNCIILRSTAAELERHGARDIPARRPTTQKHATRLNCLKIWLRNVCLEI